MRVLFDRGFDAGELRRYVQRAKDRERIEVKEKEDDSEKGSR